MNKLMTDDECGNDDEESGTAVQTELIHLA